MEEVRRLLSQYSLDALGLKREGFKFNGTGFLTYKIGKADPIPGIPDTVKVPVDFSSRTSLPDCCVLRKESNGEWRVNTSINRGSDGEPDYYSVLDYRLVKTPEQAQNGATVRPTKVLRVWNKTLRDSNLMLIAFSLENSQDKCVHVGMNGTIAIAYFNNQPKAHVEGQSVFRRRFSSSEGDGYVYITVRQGSEEYPISFELLDWQWTDTHFTECDFGEGPKWSFAFNLEY